MKKLCPLYFEIRNMLVYMPSFIGQNWQSFRFSIKLLNKIQKWRINWTDWQILLDHWRRTDPSGYLWEPSIHRYLWKNILKNGDTESRIWRPIKTAISSRAGVRAMSRKSKLPQLPRPKRIFQGPEFHKLFKVSAILERAGICPISQIPDEPLLPWSPPVPWIPKGTGQQQMLKVYRGSTTSSLATLY